MVPGFVVPFVAVQLPPGTAMLFGVFAVQVAVVGRLSHHALALPPLPVQSVSAAQVP